MYKTYNKRGAFMGRIDKNEIGYRQQLIMQCFWDAGGAATVPEVDARLEEKCGTKLSRSALNSMVQALIQKGLLKSEGKIHQSIVYRVCITQEEFRLRELKRVQKLTFGDSKDIIAQTLIETIENQEEWNRIQQYLEERREQLAGG